MVTVARLDLSPLDQITEKEWNDLKLLINAAFVYGTSQANDNFSVMVGPNHDGKMCFLVARRTSN